MESLARFPIAFPLFSRRFSTEPVTPSEPESQKWELSQHLLKQNRLNNLIYFCDQDSNGQV